MTAGEDAFWDFVLERDAIRLRREAGQPEPWTSDPVLRDYHITNVHRRLDPGTRWIVGKVRDRGLTEPEDLLFTVYAYRSLNRRETFERFGLPWRDAVCAGTWVARLDAARDAGWPLGSARHLTFWSRTRRALPRLVDARDLAFSVLGAENGVDAIRAMQKPGWMGVGPFFGTQIVADLAEISPPGLGWDRDVRVPISGGSRYALRMIYGLLSESEKDRRAFDERSAEGRRRRELDQTVEELRLVDRLLETQPVGLSSPLTCVDLEHSLCEFSRYSRLRAGDLTRAVHMMRSPR